MIRRSVATHSAVACLTVTAVPGAKSLTIVDADNGLFAALKAVSVRIPTICSHRKALQCNSLRVCVWQDLRWEAQALLATVAAYARLQVCAGARQLLHVIS
jgi:hypothetical protein